MPGGIIPTQTTAGAELPIGEKVTNDTVAPEATQSDYLSNLTLQGADRFNEALQTVENTGEQIQERDNQNWVSKTLMGARLNFMGRIADMRSNPSAAMAPSDFQSEIGDYISKVSAAAPNGRAANMLSNEMDQLTPRLMAPVFEMATKNAIAQRSAGIASTIDSGFSVAAADPTQMLQVHAQLTQMLGNNKGSISPTDYQTYGQKINQLPAATVDSVAQTNPVAATGMLNHPLVQGTMTPDAIDAAKARYEASIGTGKKAAQATLADEATNAIAALRNNGTFPAGFNPQALAQVATPKQYETFLANAYVATTMHKNDADIQAAPLTELAKMQLPPDSLNSNDPMLSREDKIATQTRDAIKTEVNLLTTDGHQAAMRDPMVSNLFKQADAVAQASPASVVDKLGLDNLIPNTTAANAANQIGQDAQATKLYQQGYQASIAYQANKGIPPELQKVMTKQEAIDGSDSLMKSNNFQDVAKALGDMQTKFGPYFPQAVAQMHALPGSNSLPAGMGLVAANLDQPFAETLYNAIKTPDGGDKDNDTASFSSQFKDRGQPKIASAIDTAVTGQETLSNLWDTLKNGNSGDAGNRYLDDVQNSVSKMAKYLYLNPPAGKTYTAQQAADLATETVVGQHLVFPDTNGVKFVIPRDPSPIRHYDDEDVSNIQAGLQSTVSDISGRFFGANKSPQEISRGNGINGGAYWVTAPDMQGAYLYRKADDQRIISNQGIKLFDGAGKPVYQSFEDARTKGVLLQQQDNKKMVPDGAIFQG